MQATNVKQVTKPEQINKVYVPAVGQKTDKVKTSESSSDSQQANYARMFEAYSDCV